jgi:hypothetical protein
MGEKENRIRDTGARLMLETVMIRWGLPARVYDDLMDRYSARCRADLEEAIQTELRRYRFSILWRKGRDADWIRSMSYGPVPDED